MNTYVWGDNPALRSEGIRDTDPQIVGERIEHLLSEHNNRLTPEDILNDAKNSESPLHVFFQQSLEDKAYKWDIQVARVIMNSLRIVYVNTSGDDDVKYALYSARQEDDKRKREYLHTDLVEVNEVARANIVEQCESQLRSLQRKYKFLEELPSMATLLEDIEKKKDQEQE